MEQHAFGNEVNWWIDVKLKDPFLEAINHYRRFKQEQKK